jgi:hypothetical protein
LGNCTVNADAIARTLAFLRWDTQKAGLWPAF